VKILVFGRNWCDYLQDDVYHGLKMLYGSDVESNVNLEYLYQDYAGDLSTLYGHGFSYAKNIDPELRRVVSEQDISQKLDASYYDLVIYLSYSRCTQQIEEVNKKLAWSRILVCDGDDDPYIWSSQFKTFKRELLHKPTDRLFPISFALPEEKIVKSQVAKTQFMSKQTPSRGPFPAAPGGYKIRPPNGRVDTSGYKFKTEEGYYNDYQISNYAFTFKKGGWDCKRHYEIMANRCVPIFEGIENCPPHILTTLPKALLKEIKDHYLEVSQANYECWQDTLFSSMKEHNTTVNLAKYIVDKG